MAMAVAKVVLFFFSLFLQIHHIVSDGYAHKSSRRVPALFTFGDSIVDTGNNNFIDTPLTADYLPYGRDFLNGSTPSGRFSNGKLISDLYAEALGIKETLPPFLDKSLSDEDLITGVSFASAGSGFDNLTGEAGGVLSLWKQVQNFKEYHQWLINKIGTKNTKTLLGDSIFLGFVGSNDLIGNYAVLPTRSQQFTIDQYINYLLNICTSFIQDLYELGVRKFAIYGISPVGCIPLLRTLNGIIDEEGCVEEANYMALLFNSELQKLLNKLQSRYPKMKMVYIDIYPIFLDILKNPTKYGYETSWRGCCGSGLTEVGRECVEGKTCANPDKHVFWDAIHSSQRTYKITSKIVMEKFISQFLETR